MATLLADPPAASSSRAAARPRTPPGAPPARRMRRGLRSGRARSAAPRWTPSQDWCLQCGAGAPGSLAAALPSWRSTAIDPRRDGDPRRRSGRGRLRGAEQERPRRTPRDGDRRPDARRRDAGHPDDAGAGARRPRHGSRTPTTTATPVPPAQHHQTAENPAHRGHAERPHDPRATTPRQRPPDHAHAENDHADDRRAQPNSRPTRDPARHQRGHHLQPLRLSGERLRRPEPRDRRRHLDRLDRAGQPGGRAEDGRGAR